ncbi:MAG TPA: hypothetical protein PK808_06130 [Polymorphobacter sp.]|nr:hypothetical protein [Polymorphobacter sp.]
MIAARPVPAVPAGAPMYRSGQCCRVCGGTHFHIGRVTAECAHCSSVAMLGRPQVPQVLS